MVQKKAQIRHRIWAFFEPFLSELQGFDIINQRCYRKRCGKKHRS
jgi:hypothetical protein